MKARTVALGGAVLTAAGVVLWRRRRSSAPPSPVQLGLSDGTTVSLNDGDGSIAELQGLADALRRQMDTSA